MAQSIPSMLMPLPPTPGICHFVGQGGADLSENLCPGVGLLSIHLEAVNAVQFYNISLKKYVNLDRFIKNSFNTYA